LQRIKYSKVILKMVQTYLAQNVLSISKQEDKLQGMGLNKDCIEQAIKDGLTQFRRATDMHPLTHGGASAWGEIVFTLRAKLKSLNNGWGYYQKNGLSITHNKDTGVAVIVTSGDKDTGLENAQPSTKNKKGPSTRNIVSSNQTPDLFDESNSDLAEVATISVDSTQTWVLLYRFDKALKEIRFELSLPSSTAKISGKDDKLKIDSWKTRILFEPLPFNMLSSDNDIEEVAFTDDVTFDISKKRKTE
jgi:hypothetical protein